MRSAQVQFVIIVLRCELRRNPQDSRIRAIRSETRAPEAEFPRFSVLLEGRDQVRGEDSRENLGELHSECKCPTRVNKYIYTPLQHIHSTPLTKRTHISPPPPPSPSPPPYPHPAHMPHPHIPIPHLLSPSPISIPQNPTPPPGFYHEQRARLPLSRGGGGGEGGGREGREGGVGGKGKRRGGVGVGDAAHARSTVFVTKAGSLGFRFMVSRTMHPT